MRAVVYCRVSTEEQVQGYSLDKQEEDCIRLIKNAGYNFIESFVDDGYSAKDMNRPALQRMLNEIPRRTFDMIVVWNSDRLTRDVIDGLTMVKTTFNKYGIKFASVTEDIDTSSYDGMMMLTMRLMMAQRERERISERVMMGQTKKASVGRRVALGAIYGYDVVDGKLKVNDEVHTVRRVFELYVYKGWGYGKIAKTFNEEGVPAKKTVWWASTIKGILQNVTYIGKNCWTPRIGDPVITDGEHEAIIPEELFSLAQTQLKRRNNLEMSRSSYNYPFSSILKCGSCGASYTAYYTRKPTDQYGYCNYRCANKKSGLCNAPDIAGKKFEKIFFEYFSKLTLQADEYVPEQTKEEMRVVEKEKSRITKELAKLEKRKSNLLDDLGDKIISREDYKMKVDEINKTVSNLQRDLELIEPPEVAATRSPNEIIDFILNLEQNWTNMQNEDQKFAIQMIFKRIEISKGDEWEIKKVEPA